MYVQSVKKLHFIFISENDFSSLYFIVILYDKFQSVTVYCQGYLQ